MIKRYLLLTSLCLVASSLSAAEKSKSPQPNIVYLLCDQWRASATGYAGDPNVKTPNLDRLAKESLNFRNAVSVCPVCTPYRAALMTGRYPTTTGMFLNDLHLPARISFFLIFEKAIPYVRFLYHTCLFVYLGISGLVFVGMPCSTANI